MEWLWAPLLILSAMDRRRRPLAVLLAVKWGLNYWSALSGAWLVPVFVDVAAGSLGVVMARRLGDVRGGAMAACFVVVPIIHAWHWILWSSDVYVGVQYYWLMLGLFTVQVLTLLPPGVVDVVQRFIHWLALSVRRRVAVVAGVARARPGSSEPGG